MSAIDLLLLHAAATWALVGLIWTVQLVQYPGFAYVGDADLGAFHQHHSSRITRVVAPLMACELATGVALFLYRPPGVSLAALWIGMALIGLNWACTAFVSVPLHKQLSVREREPQDALVATNWIRTASWSARGVWTLFALHMVLGQA